MHLRRSVMRAKCEFRVATGCCEGGYSSSCQLHSALSVHGGARDRVSIQSVSTLSVWRARRLRVKHSGPDSVNDLQHGRYSTLSVVLCDATQVLCITETVWTHETEVFCTSQRTGTVTA